MSSQSVPKLIKLVKSMRHPHEFKSQRMEHWAKGKKLLSFPTKVVPNVSQVGGERSYVLLGSLAKLERALLRWTMDELVAKHQFLPVVVPNIIHDHIIERCGFPTKSVRSQVYKISGNNKDSILDGESKLSSRDRSSNCLAGTSEFSLAAIRIGDVIPSEELPKRYCASSKCYRAETSSTSGEWGLYRVHYFNKVEMFAYTMPDGSEKMHKEFLDIQANLYERLGLQFQILDMPEDDLGLSAKRKYDIEAWMNGRLKYGEISSTSNCEEYQSSRLDIKYSKMVERNGQLQVDTGFVHTVNGTACSTIRLLIALIEEHQTPDGYVEIPLVLRSYMGGVNRIPTTRDGLLLKELRLYPTDGSALSN